MTYVVTVRFELDSENEISAGMRVMRIFSTLYLPEIKILGEKTERVEPKA